MRSFNIKALSVSGRGKKIFKAREIAREDELPAGAIDKLIKGGYIEEVKDAPVTTAKKQTDELPEKNTNDAKPEKSVPAPPKNGKK
jgi:hypothetical protein